MKRKCGSQILLAIGKDLINIAERGDDVSKEVADIIDIGFNVLYPSAQP